MPEIDKLGVVFDISIYVSKMLAIEINPLELNLSFISVKMDQKL